MILDRLLQFSNAQAITVTAPSDNVVDLQNARDIGVGDDPAMKVAIFVSTAFTAAGAATLQVQAQGSVDNSSWTTYAESATIALADLAAGRKLFPIDWPVRPSGVALPRYIRLNFIVATGPMTAGVLSAYLVLDRQDWEPMNYPAGITIAN